MGSPGMSAGAPASSSSLSPLSLFFFFFFCSFSALLLFILLHVGCRVYVFARDARERRQTYRGRERRERRAKCRSGKIYWFFCLNNGIYQWLPVSWFLRARQRRDPPKYVGASASDQPKYV